MKRLALVVLALAVMAFAFFGWGIGINNQLATRDEAVKTAWSQVENVYQRRMDLIPNLVNTVKGYASHERETLEGVIQARNQAQQAVRDSTTTSSSADSKRVQAVEQSQGALSSALSRLLVVVERYPDLKANENFKDLQVQLEGTENRIAVERKRFNEVAQEYNTMLRTFPSSLIASLRGFQPRAYFEAAAGANKAPEVKF